jgi:hypothetical protein
MNVPLLKSVMALHNDTNKDLANYLRITEQSLSNKINERDTEFKQGEIAAIKERYDLSAEQVEQIFFN